MRLRARLMREFKYLRGLLRTLGRVRSIAPGSPQLICDDIEAAVDRWRERPAILFEGRAISYGEMDAIANRYAHWAKEHGLRHGQAVAVFLPNRIDYLPIWYGLTKVGVAAALINNNLTGAALAHCLDISGAQLAIVDADTAPAFMAVKGQLTRSVIAWTLGEAHGDQRDLNKALKSCSPLRLDRASREDLTARDLAMFIYTSGTTGLPKAAKISHMRAQLYMRGFAAATGANESDRVYVTLPLYHATGGLCGMGAALLNGGSVLLRRKFSVSHFWEDIHAEGCTMFVYIGEMGRYLVNHDELPLERAHKLRLVFGNGLRPEVWDELKRRFNIPEVLEFYGSTEGNVSMFNFDGRTGAVGRVPPYVRSRFNIRLVRFDVESETVSRGPAGRCLAPDPGEIGECIGHIAAEARSDFGGYADRSASERKILRDVFEPGDAWFATGDLMRQDEDGYFYFVDRVGDTFRWKGENVSTSEVADHLSAMPGVMEATVYGVAAPHVDGRAGMASIVAGPGFSIKALGPLVENALPAYARPCFIRLQPEMEITGTFKYRKMDLVAEGFDPSRVRQPLYVHTPKGYVRITKPVFEKIMSGEMKL